MSTDLDRSPPRSTRVRRARRIATVFDQYYVDPVLGLVVPGVGDAVSSVFGLYVVGLAVAERMPLVIIARMLINLAVDALVGVVPLFGDLFDLGFKAHSRNLALLEKREIDRRARPTDYLIVAGAAVLALAAFAVPVFVAYKALSYLLS